MNPRRALFRRRVRPSRAARAFVSTGGFALVVAMLMLAIIGLASAVIMRNAVSAGQVATGNRQQAQADQYAQLALRFCQWQLAGAPASRVAALLPAADPPAWSLQRPWTNAGPGRAHTLAANEIGGTLQPRVAPQCLMEAAGPSGLYTITARGFSADFRADPITGATRSGCVVWLQATIQADGSAAGLLAIRRRAWQRLLTPPF
jgi:hypothetical protein